MKFLLQTFGSHGDVNPFLGLALTLQKRGHGVTLATNPYFESFIRDAGVPFTPIGEKDDFVRTLSHPDLWHPRRGLRFVMREGVVPLLRPSYEMATAFTREPDTAILGSVLAVGTRIAYEKWKFPYITIHLQPQAIMSLDSPPVYPQANLSRLPRWALQLMYGMGDWMVDRFLNPEFSALRRELGLPPQSQIFREWIHSPLLTLGLWPEWYAAPARDWPKSVRLSGFPFYDGVSEKPTEDRLGAFLKEGDPPVVFTPGSAMRQGNAFFRESVAACRELGCRGLLLTKFREQIPASLPPGIEHFEYVPFERVLPSAAAFVHHGGIGTTAQALRAGVPQLVMPLAHDQPDNAARVKKLGSGLVISPRQYQARRVASLLRSLIGDPHVKQQAVGWASRCREEEGLRQACERIEAVTRKG